MDVTISTKVKGYLELGRRERQCQDHVAALAAFQRAAEIDPLNVMVKIERAAALRSLDRLDEAQALVDSILEPEPHHVGALIERGYLSRRRGDLEGAAAAFKAAGAADPHNRNIQVEFARDLRALKRLDEADAILRDILAIEPRQIGALIARGHILRQRGDHAGAAAAFKTAGEADPKNWNVQVELARSLRLSERLDEVAVVLDGVLADDPRHLGALIERGHLQIRNHDRTGALATFEMTATVDPTHTGVQLEIANLLRALGRFAEAETALRNILARDPKSSSATAGLGHLLMDMNRLDEAEGVFNRAMETTPHNPRIAVALGHLARRRGNSVAALKYFTSAANADPANLDLRLDLAAELREQDDFEAARRLIQSVLDADSDHWGGWMQLGQLFRARHDRRAAMKAFQTAVVKQPSKAQGLVELAHETWAAGRAKEAEQLLHKVLAAEANHFGALMALAEYVLQTERPDEALQLARRAIEFHPGQLGPYLLAARAASHALDRNQAINILETARELFGPLPELLATQIHILRHFRDFNSARSLIASAQGQIASSFPLWLEANSFAIAMGNFEEAEMALISSPVKSKREMARIPLLRAHIAEGRRQYRQAAAHYNEALGLDPRNAHWHAELARVYLLLAEIDSARDHLNASFESDSSRRTIAGQSLNISQNHTGQLIDEFVMDPEVLARLKQIAALPDEQQIEPLKQLVRDNPDHTAPALLLMVAMRKSGAFSAGLITPASVTTPKIPRRIVQYWHSSTLPNDVRALTKTWADAHPGYTHIIFNDATADSFIRTRYPEETGRAFRHALKPPQRANIFRLAYLASEGGYFVDADDSCLAPLDIMVPMEMEFVGYQDNFGAIGSNLIGATSNHPLIALALTNAIAAANRGDRDIAWLSTGPGLLTRAFALTEARSSKRLNSSIVYDLWEAQRIIGIHCPTAYKQNKS